MGRSSSALVVLSAILLLLLLLAACNSTGKSGSSTLTEILGSEGWDADFEIRLGIPPAEMPDFGAEPQLLIEDASNKGEFNLIAEGEDTRVVYTTILYNPVVCHFVGVFGGDSGKSLFTAIEPEPGVLHFGWTIPNPDTRTGLTGKSALATFKFLPGAAEQHRAVTSAPAGNGHAVDNLECEWNDTGLVATFFERNPGDYDRNGEVGVPDITPIALNYLAPVTDYEDDVKAVIDGDMNGSIGISDITVIAINYQTTIAGYAVHLSVDGGANWIPPDPGSLHFDDVMNFVRTSPEVAISQERAYPEWTITIQTDYLNSLGIPGLDPANNDIRMRVYPSDGETIGAAGNDAEVVIAGGSDTTPPVWDSTQGVTSVEGVPNTNALSVGFGKATDDSGVPVQYRVYYAKAGDFSLDAVNEYPLGTPEIKVKYIENPGGEPPFATTLKGLDPGESYTVLVRAFDKAFPAQNFETNEVTISAAVSPNGLTLGEIGVFTFEGVPYEGNPESGDPVQLKMPVSGGDGSYSVVWSDNRQSVGYFFRNFVHQIAGPQYEAAVNWGTAAGDEWYLFEVTVTDGAGRTGLHERAVRVSRGSTANFATHVWPLFEQKCSGCHASSAIGGLDLRNPVDSFANLVSADSAALPSMKRVKPFDPGASYLMETLYEESEKRVGGIMPAGSAPLNPSELLGLLRWIITGATQGSSPNVILFGEPSLSIADVDSQEDVPVDEIPVGAFGQIQIPVLSAVAQPLAISVSSGAGANGDIWLDLDNYYSGGTIVILVGGDAAASFEVTVDVDDSSGKSGSVSIPVVITETGSSPFLLGYAADIEPLIVPKCATCHAAVQPVITAGNGFGNLVNAPSSVGGWDYIEPGFVSRSFFVNKVMGWPPSLSDAPHHLDPENDDDMKLMLKTAMWIYGGARP